MNEIIHANGNSAKFNAKNKAKQGIKTTPKYPIVTKNLFKCFLIILGAGAQINPLMKL